MSDVSKLISLTKQLMNYRKQIKKNYISSLISCHIFVNYIFQINSFIFMITFRMRIVLYNISRVSQPKLIITVPYNQHTLWTTFTGCVKIMTVNDYSYIIDAIICNYETYRSVKMIKSMKQMLGKVNFLRSGNFD